MIIDRNCIFTVAFIAFCFIVADYLMIRYVDLPWLVYPFVTGSVWVIVWQTYFHHVPKRKRAGSSTAVSSVVDGKVVIAERVYEDEFMHRECLQLSVYMNFFDVHANFWPVDGEVSFYRYVPGAHVYAYKPKSSLENEHTCTIITTPEGREVGFKQIAGGFARRIVSYADKQKQSRAGEQCGIIKFGSRIDLFLPLDAEIKVKVGEELKASESVVAVLPR